MTRLRGGVIGLGVGSQHAVAFHEHADVDLVAICDKDENKLDKARANWPHVRVYREAGDLLASGLDVVAVASYDHDHVTQIMQALEAGIHVFAEKPLCVSETELSDIAAALDRHPALRLSSNTILRRSRRFIALRELIESGKLGRIFYAEADYVYGRFHKITDGWRGASPGYSVILGRGHPHDRFVALADRRSRRRGGSFRQQDRGQGGEFEIRGA